MYSGGTLFQGTKPFLARLADLGIGCTFLTNNSSRSVREHRARLARLGIQAGEDQLYTSTQATIEYLRDAMPEVNRLFILGTPALIRELTAAGFVPTADCPSDEPDAVLVGFDTTLTYARLCRAAWWLARGKPFIATHPDRVCPTDQLTVLVDCGALCAALQEATGRRPDAVLGKPDPRMIEGILRRHGLQPHQVGMVGDRLYTDMVMARRAGAMGILVLTGETTAPQAAAAQPPPDLVVADLAELADCLLAAHRPNRIAS